MFSPVLLLVCVMSMSRAQSRSNDNSSCSISIRRGLSTALVAGGDLGETERSGVTDLGLAAAYIVNRAHGTKISIQSIPDEAMLARKEGLDNFRALHDPRDEQRDDYRPHTRYALATSLLRSSGISSPGRTANARHLGF